MRERPKIILPHAHEVPNRPSGGFVHDVVRLLFPLSAVAGNWNDNETHSELQGGMKGQSKASCTRRHLQRRQFKLLLTAKAVYGSQVLERKIVGALYLLGADTGSFVCQTDSLIGPRRIEYPILQTYHRHLLAPVGRSKCGD